MDKLENYIQLLRIKQWKKSLFMSVGFLFSSKLNDSASWIMLGMGMLVFSLVSSGTFIINDLADVHRDALHPRKKARPLVTGRISKRKAKGLSAALLLGGIAGAFFLNAMFGYLLIAYVAWSLLYTFRMKDVVILDVFAVASGYVFRILGGNFILGLVSTYWILNCAFFLALLVSLGKRYSELFSLNENAASHRKVLSHYSPQIIGYLMILASGLTVAFYSLFTYQTVKFRGVSEIFLMLTIPVVVFAIMRYCFVVLELKQGQEPEEMILTDAPIRSSVLSWLLLIGIAVYLK